MMIENDVERNIEEKDRKKTVKRCTVMNVMFFVVN